MTGRNIERMLWLATAMAIMHGAFGVKREVAASIAPDNAISIPVLQATPTTGQRRDAAGDLRAIAEGNLFRRERESIATNARAPEAQTSVAPAQPRPRLVLRGLVGGPPWTAILDGVPGHDGGVVVRAGDTIVGLTIRSVDRKATTIRGMDTTWLLMLGRAP